MTIDGVNVGDEVAVKCVVRDHPGASVDEPSDTTWVSVTPVMQSGAYSFADEKGFRVKDTDLARPIAAEVAALRDEVKADREQANREFMYAGSGTTAEKVALEAYTTLGTVLGRLNAILEPK